jgi:hypothetical protein
VRPQHLSRRRDDPQVARPRELDQLARLGRRRRHRLVEVRVPARLERTAALLEMEADRRGDRDRVDLREQVVVVGKGVRDAELLRGACRAARNGVANRGDADAVLHVGLRQVRQQAALRDGAAADDAEPDHRRRCSTASAIPSAGR